MAKPSPGEPKLSPIRRALSALGGADGQILAQAPVDAAEMTGRGIAALIPSVFGGLAALISFRYAYSLPLGAAAAAGAGWAVIVLCFDLSLMSAAPDRPPVARAVTFGARAIVSVLAAFTFASAIVMFMFARDIAVQVAKDQQTGLARYDGTVIVPAYAAKIKADGDAIAADQSQIDQASQAEASWRQKVADAEVQVTCEAQGVTTFAGCGQGSGLVGQGRVYAVRLAELRADQGALATAQAQAAAVQTRVSPQMASARAALSAAEKQEQAAYAIAQARYDEDDGLIARWRALGELESASPGVRAEVWLLEGLIIAVDLAAVIVKATSKTPSYDRTLVAERKRVTLRAAMEEEDAADTIDLRRAEREAAADIHQAVLDARAEVIFHALDAWTQVAQWRIDGWVQEQTGGAQSAEAGGGWQPPRGDRGRAPGGRAPGGRAPGGRAPGGRAPGGRGGQREPGAAKVTPTIKGHSLSRLVDEIRPHERMAVAMAPSLRRVAWMGVGLLSAQAAALLLAQAAHVTVAGAWLVPISLAAALALALYSRGFRRGPAWAHHAAFSAGLLGLALPFVILLVNI
jgi:hypothetical protein